eukprot:m.68988 g.68988  ORF g.68988 m.68988 type:complete len:515 (+) comp11621_c3_seq11:1859-3403(+)
MCCFPRLLIQCEGDEERATMIGSAVIQRMENMPAHNLSIQSLLADLNVFSPEQACVKILNVAMKALPCALYMPSIDTMCTTLSPIVIDTIVSTLQSVPASQELYVIATCSSNVPKKLSRLFRLSSCSFLRLDPISLEERLCFIQYIFDEWFSQQQQQQHSRCDSNNKSFVQVKTKPHAHDGWSQTPAHTDIQPNLQYEDLIVSKRERLASETLLPSHQQPTIRQLTSKETVKVNEEDDAKLRQLRMYMRSILKTLMGKRKYKHFIDEKNSLGRIVFELGNGGSNTGQELETPQCLLDLMENNDSGKYPLFEDFIADVDAFVEKTIKQNNKTNKACRTMRFNARELQDDVRHYCENAVQTHSKLIQECEAIVKRRREESMREAKNSQHCCVEESERDAANEHTHEETHRNRTKPKEQSHESVEIEDLKEIGSDEEQTSTSVAAVDEEKHKRNKIVSQVHFDISQQDVDAVIKTLIVPKTNMYTLSQMEMFRHCLQQALPRVSSLASLKKTLASLL